MYDRGIASAAPTVLLGIIVLAGNIFGRLWDGVPRWAYTASTLQTWGRLPASEYEYKYDYLANSDPQLLNEYLL